MKSMLAMRALGNRTGTVIADRNHLRITICIDFTRVISYLTRRGPLRAMAIAATRIAMDCSRTEAARNPAVALLNVSSAVLVSPSLPWYTHPLVFYASYQLAIPTRRGKLNVL